MQLIGSQLGDYHLLQLIGAGGMGEVYLAEDHRVGRQVALKVIRIESFSPDPSVAEKAIRLFWREVKALANLNHPHILSLYHYGEEKRQGTHDKQIIHRDIKPANFLLGSWRDSTVPDLLLADFGIAAIMNATTSAEIRGTPAYMAPEQWEGHPVPATDQYALAVMAYNLLTGHTPFKGNEHQLMYNHLHVQPQPPSTLNPRISLDIDAVILKALEKKSEDRFPSVLVFAQAFQKALGGDEVSSTAKITNGRDGLTDLLKPLFFVRLSIFFAAIFGLALLAFGPSLAIPAIPYVGLVLIIISWGLGLIHSFWLKRWNWFISILLLSPLAGIAYGFIGPTRKPQGAQVHPLVRVFKNKTSKARQYIAWVIGVVLVVEVIAFGTYTNYAANSAIYNAIAPDKENSYAMLTHGNPTQYYPLINNTGDNKWEERTGCTFTAQAYHVSIDSQDINPCFLQGITFSNFVFEVRMTIIAGNTGGILFRDSGGNGKGLFYYLSIDTNGLYYLSFYVDRQSSNFHNLINGTASAFRTGLGQTNIIAMVANGSTFDLYVNQQYLDSVSDNSSEQGSIALVADGVSEVVYSEAKVWIL